MSSVICANGTAAVAPVPVPVSDAAFGEAYQAALRAAERKSRKLWGASEDFINAATDAVLWARDHCRDASTFGGLAAAAVKKWLWRAGTRHVDKLHRRPDTIDLHEASAVDRERADVRPLLIEDLPEEMAFAVRLYMVDGYTLRECGMLMGKSPNTVDLMLKRAAAMLAEGRMQPARRKGEKRLMTAGNGKVRRMRGPR